MKDYYQILGLERSASQEAIRKAFHKLAHKYHPDKKGGDETKFKEVNEAYQVLSDKRRRKAYDTYGSDNAFSESGATGAGWDFSGFSAAGGQGFQFDLGDLFGEFFNGGRTKSRVRRGRDISVDIQIPFADAIFGSERNILITKVGVCDKCNGLGGAPGATKVECGNCNGQGKLHETRRSLLGSFTAMRECEVCGGSGQVPDKRCESCSGHGVMRKNEEIKVSIPAGINDGEMIRLASQGEAIPQGIAGDLYVKVHVEAHSVFRREGDNLSMDLPIKLTDAILGTETDLQTLDGKIKLKIPIGISSGEILRVKGKGVPITVGRRGDLYIHFRVKTPVKLSRQAKKLVEDLKNEGL